MGVNEVSFRTRLPVVFSFFVLLSIIVIFFSSCNTLGGGGAKPVNNPPNSPSNPFPEDGMANAPIRPTLSWTCSDPDGDPVTYDVYFGTSQDNLELLVSNLSQSSYELGENLNYSTTYYWKVVAKDDSGAQTEGSVWSFTTIPAPNHPPVFSNVYPQNGAVNRPLNLILQWHAEDVDGDDVSYDLYFGTSENLVLLKGNTKDEFYQFGISGNINLDYNTTYYWKVVARDGRGGRVDTGLMRFTTQLEENENPVVNYLWPPDGAQISSYSVTLQWNANDPNGDTISYDIYFGDNPNPPLFVSNHSGRSYKINGLLPNKTYYWKIVAKDSRGGITYGDVWSFVTPSNNPPNPFSLLNPCPPIPIRDVVLRWTETGDPDGDPVRYRIYFGTRNPPPLYRSGLRSGRIEISERLDYGRTYYWKVIAEDDKGNTRESEVKSFTTSSNIAPQITSVSPSDGDEVDRMNLVLRLSVSDQNNDRWKIVRVEMGTRPDSMSTIQGESGWFENGSTYSIPLDLLPANTRYYWRVTVMDEGGLETSTAILTFKTKDR